VAQCGLSETARSGEDRSIRRHSEAGRSAGRDLSASCDAARGQSRPTIPRNRLHPVPALEQYAEACYRSRRCAIYRQARVTCIPTDPNAWRPRATRIGMGKSTIRQPATYREAAWPESCSARTKARQDRHRTSTLRRSDVGSGGRRARACVEADQSARGSASAWKRLLRRRLSRGANAHGWSAHAEQVEPS